MTKIDFIIIAKVLRDTPSFMRAESDVHYDLLDNLCKAFKRDNPRFDEHKFRQLIYE